jgi:hypothetical protein
MLWRIKFVAGLLLMAVLAMPAAAFSAYWSVADPCPCCHARMQSADLRLQEAPASMPCCEISSPKPVPVAVAMPPASVAIAPPLSAGAVVVHLPNVLQAEAPPSPGLAPSASAQAVLCVFLV